MVGVTVGPMQDTYDPRIYDLFHPLEAADSDVAYYVAVARREGAPVLELGAGTGRTLLPVARAGVGIVGVDTSPRMLEALQHRLADESPEVRARVTIREGDMRTFRAEAPCAVVQSPFRGFLHNVTRRDQLACLAVCRDNLRAGGVLTFSVFHPSLAFMGKNSGDLSGVWRWRDERPHPDGGRVTLSECTTYDTVHRCLSSRLRYDHWDAGGDLVRSHLHVLELAYLYPGDIRGLLAEAGFEHVEIAGGFDGAPFDADGQELIVTARRG